MSRPAQIDLKEAIEELIESGAVKVPPYPAVALKLRDIVHREDFGISEVLAVIAADASLVADVLRCANSAYYGKGASSTLQQAVLRIGAEAVERLALASGMVGLVRAPGSLQSLKRTIWQSSVTSALICQELALLRKLDAESGFIAGLLHDFGWVVGVSAIEHLLVLHPDLPARSREEWMQLIEPWHVQLGELVAGKWKLPPLLCAAISFHHGESAASGEHAQLVELVQLADAVTALLAARPHVSAEELAQLPRLAAGEAVPLARILPSVPAMIAAFETDPVGKPAPGKVLAETAGPVEFRQLQISARQLSPRPSGPYQLLGIAQQGCLLRSPQPIAENQLLELELALAPSPFRLWAAATRCKPDAGSFLLECKPFALTGRSLERWNDLCLAPLS